VQATWVKFGLHADNTKFNTQNEQDRQCTYNVTLSRVRPTTVAVKKAISITCSMSVFAALGIQHAVRMRHTIICGLLGSTEFFHIIS
jgi:hypothetical protein